MPFIDSKVTVSLTDDKKEQIKSRFGQAVSQTSLSYTHRANSSNILIYSRYTCSNGL
jgi:hypothetical protein